MLFHTNDILETTRMITENKLDVRTITMGISLRDCGHSDMKVTAQKVYDKICIGHGEDDGEGHSILAQPLNEFKVYGQWLMAYVDE